jgi:hypothetical protein
MKKLLLVFLLTAATLCADTASDLQRAYLNNRILADMFMTYAAFDPGYRPIYQYFRGRADAFADAYLIVTGTQVE